VSDGGEGVGACKGGTTGGRIPRGLGIMEGQGFRRHQGLEEGELCELREMSGAESWGLAHETCENKRLNS